MRAGVAVVVSAGLGADLLKPRWFEDPHIQKYQSLTFNGEKPVGVPLLVIHGASDPNLSNSVTDKVVAKTMDLHPTAQIEYVTLEDISHVPALPASQRIWMDWIAHRFDGLPVACEGRRSTVKAARPAESYQAELNWYIEPASPIVSHVIPPSRTSSCRRDILFVSNE